jgi:hypothetical protein
MEEHQLIPEDIRDSLPPAFDASDPILPGLGRTDRIHMLQLQSKYHKLYSALGGGLALIIPMVSIDKLLSDMTCTDCVSVDYYEA